MPDDQPLAVVLDVANVVGSRPDGWWRDRAGAAERVLGQAGGLLAGGDAAGRVASVVAVLEGAARQAVVADRPGLLVVRAERDGDTAVVGCVLALVEEGVEPGRVRVVTADRGLRERLPPGVVAVGPRWWHEAVAAGAGA